MPNPAPIADVPNQGLRRLAHGLALAAMSAATGCSSVPDHPTPVPDNSSLPALLKVSVDDILQDTLDVHGQERYSCVRGAAGLSWVDRGSEATLVDNQSHSVGMITSNNYFIGDDDTYLIEHVVAEQKVTDDALAWRLSRSLYNASKAPQAGRFGQISAVQRVQTSGGLPPDRNCHIDGESLYVPYGAIYLLYRSPATMASPPMAKAHINPRLAAVPRVASEKQRILAAMKNRTKARTPAANAAQSSRLAAGPPVSAAPRVRATRPARLEDGFALLPTQ